MIKLKKTVVIFVLFFVQCSMSQREEAKQINSQDSIQTIEEQYHYEVIKKRGRKYYFIPKEKVYYFFKSSDLIEKTNINNQSKVIFFDQKGNVVYQAQVYSIVDSLIMIKCLDLKNVEEYIIPLNVKKIKDLDSTEVITYKFYK